MPYDIVTKDGIRLENIPDDMPPDAPELRQLVQRRRVEIRNASPEFQAKVSAQQAADRERYDPTKGMSWGEKAAANLGAGTDNLITGVQDLFGAVSDEEIAEKRARDKHLADKTTGGGALQFAGEVLPTLAIPAGAYAKAAQGGGRVLKGALGLQNAARAAAPVAARLGGRAAILDGAIAGGIAGALRPTMGNESRALNAATGGAFGAALPMALGVGRKGFDTLTRRGAAGRVASDMQEAVGQPNITQAVGDLQTHFPRGAENVPLSSAAVLQNPALARMERTSRANPRTQPGWFDLDKRQAQEAWAAVEGATQEAGELAARQGERSANWASNWAAAEKGAKPRIFSQRMGQLKMNLDEAAQSPEAVNPLVMKALQQVDDTVTQFGAEFGPAHLQQLRAQLNGRASLQPGATALQSAPRENKAIISLIDELDDILNATTGSRWDKVKQGYTQDTQKVHASKAAKIVREKFVDDATGRVQGAGSKFDSDLPEVTATGLGRALDAARKKDKSLALSSDANTRLMNLQNVLRKQGITQGVARTATAGGGSNTAGDIGGAAAQQVAPSLLVQALTAAGQGVKNVGQRKYDDALADALRDPAVMLQMLQQKIARNQPLTGAEDALLRALRGTTATSGAGALPQQQPMQ